MDTSLNLTTKLDGQFPVNSKFELPNARKMESSPTPSSDLPWLRWLCDAGSWNALGSPDSRSPQFKVINRDRNWVATPQVRTTVRKTDPIQIRLQTWEETIRLLRKPLYSSQPTWWSPLGERWFSVLALHSTVLPLDLLSLYSKYNFATFVFSLFHFKVQPSLMGLYWCLPWCWFSILLKRKSGNGEKLTDWPTAAPVYMLQISHVSF